MKTFINRKTILLFTAVIILAAALMIIPRLLSAPTQGNVLKIRVSVDGVKQLEQALKPGQTIEIRQDNGNVNVIRMTEDGFYMESSTCKNQDCVHQGKVTKDNYSKRILGNYVICLPNRVEVQLIIEGEPLAPVMPDASIQVKVGSI